VLTPLRLTLPPASCARWLAQLGPLDGRSRPLTELPLDAADVLQVVADSSIGPLLHAALGAAPWCNLSQSWLRHGRPPHGWHQDGALRHDFMTHHGRPVPPGAALEMRTAWIALTPCGELAPSLEWIDAVQPTLLTPDELTDGRVAFAHAGRHTVKARMAAADVLLFDGLLLHRTYLTAAMSERRTSLELRFFCGARLPARVARDRGLLLPPSPATRATL
jgi:hypothetical protein